MYLKYYPREKLTKIAKRAFTRWGKILTGQTLGEQDISRFVWKVQSPPRGIDYEFYYTARRNLTEGWDLVYSRKNINIHMSFHSLSLENRSLKEVVSYLYLRETPKRGPGLFTSPSDLRRVAEMIMYDPPQLGINEWRPKNSPRIPRRSYTAKNERDT